MRNDLSEFLNPPKFSLISKRTILVSIIGIFIFIALMPWFAFTSGMGRVTALDPNERIQEINSPVSGFISKWYVKEDSELKKGDIMLELMDTDSDLMERIGREKDAAASALKSAEYVLKTAQLNLDRQAQLLKDGLTSRKDYEKAKIEVSKFEIEVQKARTTLAKAETQISRQSSQKILAPRDGRVLRIMAGEGNKFIKAGDHLLVFSPTISTPTVEIWVSGNDTPYIKKGQKARIQFEGWPAVQIPGWPSLAIGTFKAKVQMVDQASSYQGKFRVLLIADEDNWPSEKFLRLNSHARGIIYLRDTLLGIELWRQLNAFPMVQEPINDELSTMLISKDSKKSKETKSSGEEK